jgi:hypothetical protein
MVSREAEGGTEALWCAAQAEELDLGAIALDSGSGGLTSFSRCRLEIPKTHARDVVRQVDAVARMAGADAQHQSCGTRHLFRSKADKRGMPRSDCMHTQACLRFPDW